MNFSEIYSSTSLSFIKKCTTFASLIMKEEMNLNLSRHRFLWKPEPLSPGHRVPLNFVVFQGVGTLGFFNSHLYQIALNKSLMLESDQIIKDVIRHELAHLITFLTYSDLVKSHGPEYRKICESYHWKESVYLAYKTIHSPLTNENENPQAKIISKLKKLTNLASSDNIHESMLAVKKANELLLKYNLQEVLLDYSQDEVLLKKVLSGKRVTSIHKAIYEILNLFHVQAVFNHAKGYFYLEIIGDKVNVEMSEYVANFLVIELEKIWTKRSKADPKLRGITKKNSFMKGLADGYKEKILAGNSPVKNENALILLEKSLSSKVKKVYPSLRFKNVRQAKSCSRSHHLGKDEGRKLHIRPGIEEKTSSKKRLLLD